MTNSFSQQFRLIKAYEFRRVFDNSKIRLSSDGFKLYACKNQVSAPRLGMVVARREIPKAVQRNAIKRHIRETFRIHKKLLEGYDIVIIVKKAVLLQNRLEIKDQLELLWKKLNDKCKTA